ncbi:uncharacterized protein FIBRA_01234 [Fibroporia radiculosa]|uniref:Peptidase S53 domain-containing protein n=1 Tax=Fibroporia radiculosa TaxID=599839 RepID=J4H0Z7_9APHY|nr:uncharacterized protein FIBRA_01234 [Fibroporia radiculosa]CCL99219.1 predicted protein [Fibroporia radiculosa]
MFLALFVAASLVQALGTRPPRVLQQHEVLGDAPAGYVLTRPALPESVLTLRLALTQSNISGLIDELYDVEEFVSPLSESITAVQTWLGENNLTSSVLSPAGDWVEIQVPVEEANTLLDANFSIFTHTDSGIQTTRTLGYSIPTDLLDHLDLIHPTVTFPHPYENGPKMGRSTMDWLLNTTSTPCANSSSIDPACLQYLYNIPSTPAVGNSSKLGVPAYVNFWANRTDLKTFLEIYRPDMNPSTTYAFQSIDNGTDPQNVNVSSEANLDTQYTVGLATDVPITFISVGGFDFPEALLNTAIFLLAQQSPPQVISDSYGYDENLVSQKLAYRLCNTYAQLGARGTSVLFGSGDGGVTGLYPNSSCTGFVPTFPSGCPFVTSIGGTVGFPQQAANFSGGGFSNYWGRPDYQSDAVSAYLRLLGNNNTGMYNISGRAFPDLATYAVDFEIVLDGEVRQIYGTSCASPTFASIVALLNDQLIAAGKPVLGFLNPFLYTKGVSALTDVVAGYNIGCGNSTGFYATVGWDPVRNNRSTILELYTLTLAQVTGLGTPDFVRLKNAVGLVDEE